MSKFIKDFVIHKMKHISAEELLHYSKQYRFHISLEQSRQITAYLQTNTVDPFNKADRNKMFTELSRITDRATAKKAEQLFQEIIKANGFEHLF